MARTPKSSKQIDALKHNEATRRNIPTAEMESFFQRDEDSAPRPPQHYARTRPLAEGEKRTEEEPRAPELIWNGARITITDEQMTELAETGTLTLSDAQLVWRGKDRQDWSDLVVNVPPLYIQEKIHPKAIIDDLKRRTAQKREAETDSPDLFADFNGITPEQRAEFYQHDQHWSNRMILGDSLQVMASLAERESLKGKVQCIYFDPPYGIKFNSNWQVSTQSRDVKDGKQTDISREPEQVKSFRDTWKDGIHSYLTYLRDRFTVMQDLLTDAGSIFVQISDENVHRVRGVLDEVFGSENFVSEISFNKNSGFGANLLATANDYIVWYAKNKAHIKYRQILMTKSPDQGATGFTKVLFPDGSIRAANKSERDDPASIVGGELAGVGDLTKPGPGSRYDIAFQGNIYRSEPRWWGTTREGMQRLILSGRVTRAGKGLGQLRRLADNPSFPLSNVWTDTVGQNQFGGEKTYIVQTALLAIERCILMTTDPGDLVLDPTCGSGSTAYVAEQWGRRWITIDTSRVALALARTRLMAARYNWYLLADSREGRAKEAELTKRPGADAAVHNDIRQGFIYERVPHITLRSIANNPLIDDIWESFQAILEPLRIRLNALKNKNW